MSKKLKSLSEWVFAAYEHQANQIGHEIGEFYPEGLLAPLTYSSSKAPFSDLIKTELESLSPEFPSFLSQEKMIEECWKIWENVRCGKNGNIAIHLDTGTHIFEKRKLDLGNTLIKVRAFYSGKVVYVFIKAGSTIDARIFIGGDNVWGFLAVKNPAGPDTFIRLQEFHLLSIHENQNPKKEIGLMASYVWPSPNVYSCCIFGSNLHPLKNLLLAEWFQSEWQRTKEATVQNATEESEVSTNEQK